MALGCGNSILACQGRRDDGGPLRRCYLKGRVGDAANVALSAVGHNFRRILAGISLAPYPDRIAAINIQAALRSAS